MTTKNKPNVGEERIPAYAEHRILTQKITLKCECGETEIQYEIGYDKLIGNIRTGNPAYANYAQRCFKEREPWDHGVANISQIVRHAFPTLLDVGGIPLRESTIPGELDILLDDYPNLRTS